MKILNIRLSNLNSLKGDFFINLEHGVLQEAGIFAITGATGSGKSTILDAITLALFGKAARYDDGTNVQNMMSRGTGECKAEIVFSCNGTKYSAKWFLARARKKADGKFQAVKRELSIVDGDILFVKKNEIDAHISELTGLDYKRFLRSVLLAQGQFKEFLDASSKARGELLERITGTQIYSELGRLSYVITKEKNSEISDLEQEVAHLNLLSEEEKQHLSSEDQEIIIQIKSSTEQSQELNQSELQIKSFFEYQDKVKNHEHLKVELTEMKTISDQNSPKLLLHCNALKFQKDLFSLEEANKSQSKARYKLLSIEKSLPQVSEKLLEFQSSLKSYYQNQIKITQSKIVTKKNECLDIQHNISLAKEYIHQKIYLDRVIEEFSSLKEDHSSMLLIENKIKIFIDQSQKIHKKNGTIEEDISLQITKQLEIEKIVSEAFKVFQKTKETHQDLLQEQSFEDFQIVQKDLNKRLLQIHSVMHELIQYKEINLEEKKLFTSLKDLKVKETEISIVLDQQIKELKVEENIEKDKLRILYQSQKIQSLSQQRAQLIDQESCPLCGSLDHPFASNLEQDIDQDQENYDKQHHLVKDLVKSSTQSHQDLEHFKQSIESSNKDLKITSLKVKDLQNNLESQCKILELEDLVEFDGPLYDQRLQSEEVLCQEKIITIDQNIISIIKT
ncbi:hypothetical protein MJH12_07745, partial [bacterium]|nr:hypothetical protein [bacterium]